ncbi:MAG: TIGR01777 family oxidoreductase [Desulforhopalus sp.]
MKTMITGSSGLVGSALIEYLFKKGHSIECLKRNYGGNSHNFWATDMLSKRTDRSFQNIIHLAGANVTHARWTPKRKRQILLSRVEGTRRLVDYIYTLREKPNTFMCASATGYYGNRGDEILNEDSTLGNGFLADVCHQWEQETHRLTTLGVRVVNLRFGMILSPRGGALQKMIPLYRSRLGGIIGRGNQHISWISSRDLSQIVEFIINNDHIKGPVNIVSPIQTTNRELTRALGKSLGRLTPVRIPGVMVKLLFGQLADEVLLSSTRVTPKVLLESGYKFSDQSLDAVLRNCINSPKAQPAICL